RAQPGSRQLDDRRPQPGADPSLPTAVSIPPTLAIALVWPGRQYLSQFRLGQFQYHLPNSSSQRFAQPIRSKTTFHFARTLYTFPHRRIPPRSDSPHEPDSFLGYRENTPSLFSTTSGPPPLNTAFSCRRTKISKELVSPPCTRLTHSASPIPSASMGLNCIRLSPQKKVPFVQASE